MCCALAAIAAAACQRVPSDDAGAETMPRPVDCGEEECATWTGKTVLAESAHTCRGYAAPFESCETVTDEAMVELYACASQPGSPI
jgi:hypothetical protein